MKICMLKEILDIEEFLASSAVTYKSKRCEDSKRVSDPPITQPRNSEFSQLIRTIADIS